MNKISKICLPLFVSIALFSCSEAPKKEESTAPKQEQATTPAATSEQKLTYKCPMDCENGKTYETAGKCPVCKMDLASNQTKKEEQPKH